MITRIIAYSQRAPPHCPDTSTATAWHQAFAIIPPHGNRRDGISRQCFPGLPANALPVTGTGERQAYVRGRFQRYSFSGRPGAP